MDTGRCLVVGVDGSVASEGALRWAMAEAARTGDSVQVIAAWRWQPVRGTLIAVTTAESLREWTQRMADEIVRAARVAYPAVSVRLTVIEGDPHDVLVRSVLPDDLLVLGSHRHGHLHQALLGSTIEACVRRARCPVVVVPSSPAVAVSAGAHRPLVRAVPAAAVTGIVCPGPGRPLVAPRDRIEL